MKFLETEISGVYVIESEMISDDRGFFARAMCATELRENGLECMLVQANISYNKHAGTVRGMHFQRAPAEEVKLVRCTRGSILDVAIDLRPDSVTYLHHVAVELTADNRRSLYVPRQFAHGFQTLVDDTEVNYLVSEFYSPEHESGLRHDDPKLTVSWPMDVTEISEKDRAWPLLG